IKGRSSEHWSEYDHHAQLLHFFGRPVARILAVGHGQIELRFQQSRRERYGLAELQYVLSTVSGNEGCAKIRMRVSKIGSDAQSLTKLGDSRLVLVALCQHQPHRVVGIGEVRAYHHGLAEVRQ